MYKTIKGSLARELRPELSVTQDTAFLTAVSPLAHTDNDGRNVTIDSSLNVIFNTSHTTYSNLDRISPTNVVDSSFRTAQGTGFVYTDTTYYGGDFNYDGSSTIIEQSDGKIITGSYYSDGTGYAYRLTRINANGTADTAFNANAGTFSSWISSITIDANSKILVSGQFASYNSNTRKRLVRLNSDGTEDTAFYTNLGTGFGDDVWAIAIQSDGKLLVGGSFITFNGNSRKRLVRLNSDGTEDTAFYTTLGTGFNDWITNIQLDGSSNIYCCGDFDKLNGSTVAQGLVKLSSAGALNSTYNTNLGTGFGASFGNITVIKFDGNGKLLVGGYFTTFNGNTRKSLVRLNSDGTEDTTFYTNLGTGFDSDVLEIIVDGSNNLYVGGYFTTINGHSCKSVAKVNSDGTENTAFTTNVTTKASTAVHSLLLTSTNKLLCGYSSTGANFDSTLTKNIFALSTAGVFDTSFHDSLFNGYGWASGPLAAQLGSTVQADGDILVYSYFTTFNSNTRKSLVRLNSDGTEDTAFYTNLGTSFLLAGGTADVNDVKQQLMDTDLLVGGDFTTFNGNTRNRLVRLNSDGTEDTAFYTNLGSGFDGIVNKIAVQSDNKIIVVGVFANLNGTARNRIVRLNSDGTVDTTFTTNIGTGPDATLEDVCIDNSGKILVSGYFITWDGANADRLVRLNSDGTKDTTFNTNLGTGFDNGVQAVKVQTDNKIVVTGYFTALNGTSRPGIVRLNDNGTVDTDFSTIQGSGIAASGGYGIVIDETNDWIYLSGGFVTYNGTSVNQIVKLYQSTTIDYNFVVPTGVTELILTPCDTNGVPKNASRTITVVPNTSYAITINSSTFVLNNANSFGTLFYWTNTASLLISWVE